MDSKAVQRSALCRSRRELSNDYLLAKIGVDTAENEPCKVCPLSAYRSPRYERLNETDLADADPYVFASSRFGFIVLREKPNSLAIPGLPQGTTLRVFCATELITGPLAGNHTTWMDIGESMFEVILCFSTQVELFFQNVF